MTNPILTKLNKMIENRVDVARRWHGIKDVEIGRRFVANDADIQSYLKANRQVAEALVDEALERWFAEIIDGVNIAKHRERFGDELVDRILASSAKLGGSP
jgi:hypothetical protein